MFKTLGETLGLAALGAALAFAASYLAAPGAQASEGPVIGAFTLENGMRGVVIEDRRAPVVTHMVWYQVGAADEPPGKSGIAHFLEHLMFKGTETLAPGEFSDIVAANGGRDNAFTSLDYTGYFQRIASDRLGLVMSLEADRMRNLALDEESVRTERDVIIEERNSRTDNDPGSQFFEQLNAALYQNHPYGVPIIGWRHEIETLTREDALAFYERFYGPENAVLVVAGDVDLATVEALAKEHYGPIERTGAGPYSRPTEPPHRAARRIEMVDEKVRQPFMVRAYLTDSYSDGDPRETAAMALMAEILGGGRTARLAKSLVLDQQIALSAGASYRGLTRDHASFSIFATPAPTTTLDQLEAAVDATLAELAANPPTQEELDRARMVLISRSIYQQDSQSSMARLYGSALMAGLEIEDVRDWPERLRAVEIEDVRAAVARLEIEASVTGRLMGPDDVDQQ